MPENYDKARKLIAELIVALPGYTPLPDLTESSEASMRYALASMYKEKGYRDYMVRAIRLNLEGFQHVTDDKGVWIQQGRLLVMKELLMASKQMYQEMDKVDKSLEKRMKEEASA